MIGRENEMRKGWRVEKKALRNEKSGSEMEIRVDREDEGRESGRVSGVRQRSREKLSLHSPSASRLSCNLTGRHLADIALIAFSRSSWSSSHFILTYRLSQFENAYTSVQRVAGIRVVHECCPFIQHSPNFCSNQGKKIYIESQFTDGPCGI